MEEEEEEREWEIRGCIRSVLLEWSGVERSGERNKKRRNLRGDYYLLFIYCIAKPLERTLGVASVTTRVIYPC